MALEQTFEGTLDDVRGQAGGSDGVGARQLALAAAKGLAQGQVSFVVGETLFFQDGSVVQSAYNVRLNAALRQTLVILVTARDKGPTVID